MGRTEAAKIGRLFLFMFMMSWIPGNSLGTQQSGLLFNGDFEAGFLAGIAFGWSDNSGWADLKVRYSPDQATAHRGTAQKIECSDFESGAVQFVQGGKRLASGRAYDVGIWMKGAAIDAPVEVLLRKRGVPYTTYFSKSFKVTDAWREYQFGGVAPVDDPDALFMVRFAGTGTLWVDDASLSDSSGRVASLAPPSAGNLLANGSFEVGLDRWQAEIRETGGYEYHMPIEMLNRRPVVVTDSAKAGRSSLKISVPKNGRMTLTSPYIKINTGRKHSLSLWAASDKSRNIRIGLRGGSWGQSSSQSREIKVERAWKRYTFSAVLPAAPEDAYHVLIEAEGEGDLWIDGVQLEEGEATAFRSRSIAEVGLTRLSDPALVQLGENMGLAARVFSEVGGDFPVSVTSVDYYGKKSVLWEGAVTLSANGRREIALKHPTDRPGYFRLIAEVGRAGKLLDTSEMAIGVVPKRAAIAAIDSPFGIHARFNAENLTIARNMGVAWLRMHPPLGTKWAVIEKNKGQFIFFDKSIMLAKSLGFNILGSLDTTPQWASTAPAGDSASYRAYPPKHLEDWTKYVYETVLHYKGIIDYWEVWNEPDSTGFLKIGGILDRFRRPAVYADLLKAAYGAAKRANPNAVIVGGVGTAKPPTDWVEKIFSEGAYGNMDVLSFHFYTDGRPGDALDTTTGVYVGQMKAMMRKYGKGEKPVWETESGIMYPETAYQNILEITQGYQSSGRDATAYLVRNYVHLLASGVSKWFYYSMFPSHRIDRIEATGMLEWDGSPRPQAVAYGVLSSLIGNGKFSRALNWPGGAVGAEFRAGNRVIQIIWANGWSDSKKITATVDVPATYTTATVYDAMGGVRSVASNKKTINVVAAKEPLYAVFTK